MCGSLAETMGGELVLPGLVDTHRHTWQALFRNIASDWTLSHYFTGLHGTSCRVFHGLP